MSSVAQTFNNKPLFTRNTFMVSIQGVTIGIFTNCSGLRVEVEVFEYAEGGVNESLHHLPGRLRYPHLVLSRGLTDEKALLDWFSKSCREAERKEITVTLEQAGGSGTRSWTFADAYPVSWTGPELDTHNNAIGGETLTIAHSGMQQV
jgi:phage tail-like protein